MPSVRATRARDASEGFMAPAPVPRGVGGEIVSASRRMRVFQVVTILAAVFAYLTVVVGGDVRSSGAGMACPEWPLCAGGLIPDFSQPGVAIEFTHRVVAFSTGVVILATLVLAYLWYRRDLKTVVLATASLVLVVAQVYLGMLTIDTDLSGAIVTSHLAVGTATFATALALAVASLVAPPLRPSPDWRRREEPQSEPEGAPRDRPPTPASRP